MAMPLQFARVLFWFSLGKKEWTNVLWFNIGGTFSGSFDIAAAANSLSTVYTAKFLPLMGPDAFYDGIDLHINNNGISSTISTYAGAPGTGPDLAAPSELAALVRLQTATPGGSGRGRIYVSGIDVGQFQDGRIASASLANFQLLATLIKSTITIQGQVWTPCVKSKKLDQLETITTATAEVNLGTQRRRRPRR